MTMEYLDPTRVVLHFEMPLAELIVDYYDQLKSRTQGYASMDYEELGYRAANLVKVDVLVNGEPVDALSLIVHRDNAQTIGPGPDRAAQAAHPAPDVRGPDPGRDRLERHRARDGPGDAQERPRQVLRWRHHPQAQAAREAEGRQAAHEAGRLRRDPAGGVPGDAPHGRGLAPLDGRLPRSRPVLIGVGLALLLVDAPARRRAVRDRRVRRGDARRASASLRRRLAWYGLGLGLAVASCSSIPSPQNDLFLGSGDRLGAVLGGLAFGGDRDRPGGRLRVARYHRLRFPDTCVVPGCPAQFDRHRVHRRGRFRGALLGTPVVAGVDPSFGEFAIQALLYTLTTRLGAPGRDRYMLVLTLVIGLIGGWLTS